jgi:hypothetical protein
MWTNKWFLTRVRQLMGLKMALGNELLVTLWTHKRTLPCVRAHMRL